MNEKDSQETPVTLMDFLLHRTPVHDLCVIRDAGYIRQVVYIDHEDLFLVHPQLQTMPVKSHGYGTLPIVGEDRQETTIPCHYVDV